VGSKPKAPKEDPQSQVLRARQAEQLTQLDEEQNTRIKRLFSSSSGLRAFRGSPEMRLAPGNSSGTSFSGSSSSGPAQSNAPGYQFSSGRMKQAAARGGGKSRNSTKKPG